MKSLKKYVCLILFFSFCWSVRSQNQIDSSDQLKMISAYFKDNNRVVLRWVPSTPGLWRTCNFYGYTLERAEVDTLVTGPLNWTSLATIKPLSLENWKIRVNEFPKDTMLMVAGQAIHGEKNVAPFSLENMIQKSDQLQNYYSACILASEFSAQAALAAGLRFEDNTIKQNTTYLYRLSINIQDSLFQFIQGISSVETSEKDKFPMIQVGEIIEGERLIEFKWNRDYYKNYYSAFNVYRSGDQGKSWEKLNKKPVSYLAYKENNKYIFRDSVAKNYVEYHYKIEGITPYATLGPMSNSFSAQARDRTPPDAPYNVKTKYLGNQKMKITWSVNQNDKDISGFRISRSNEIDKGFVELTQRPLPPGTRSFVDSTCNELINNYYFIGVLDHEGNANVSMPEYGTIIDSIPPKAPVGLKGMIDTNGVVTLTWRLGMEPDLKGYFVHYSNHSRHTFINVTDFHLEDTIWRDTIPLNVLTENIYYKVVAIDHRSNYSPYSDMITLKKPDLVPPASPIFIKSESKKDGIEIHWYNSSSVDVTHNTLLRRKKGEVTFEEIHRVSPYLDKMIYLDKNVNPGVAYEYQLVAVDDVGLHSRRVGILSATAYHTKSIPGVQDFSGQLVESPTICVLKWVFIGEKEVRYVLYRSVNNQPYSLYKSMADVQSYKDKSYRKGDIVKYKIKVINPQGWQSDFSKELIITW